MERNDLPKLLTAPMAAKLLNISRPHLYRMIKEEGLKAYRFGNTYRINREDLLNFLKKSQVKETKHG